METPPPLRTIAPAVLVVAPRQDQIAFSRIVRSAFWPTLPERLWRIAGCRSLHSALRRLRVRALPIVLCDCDLGNEIWIELLRHLEDSPAAPLLIVTSRLADDHLWVEALNRGVFDVLAKPFDAAEVVRTLSFAWLHWAERNGVPDKAPSATIALAAGR